MSNSEMAGTSIAAVVNLNGVEVMLSAGDDYGRGIGFGLSVGLGEGVVHQIANKEGRAAPFLRVDKELECGVDVGAGMVGFETE